MYYKIVNMCDWNNFQKSVKEGSLLEVNALGEEYLKSYSILIDSLGEQISILDEFYGKERKAERDLGGVAYCFTIYEDYKRFLESIKEVHHISEIYPEYTDVIVQMKGYEMIQELFIISNDFAVIMIYPRVSK